VSVQVEHPALRVVRLRPGLIFQRDIGTEISRYFLGPFVPTGHVRRACP
jgi:UDP-glucose 4-epimerase